MAAEAVLLVGGGGREHAIGEAIGASPEIPQTLYITPGNVGLESRRYPGMDVVALGHSAAYTTGIVNAAEDINSSSDLTVVVGPEAPLVAGLADRLRERGVAVFGPSAEASRLEGSKIFATEFMRRHSIPHPRTTIIRTSEEAGRHLWGTDPETIVLKANGLAGGKGVILPQTHSEMYAAVRAMLDSGARAILDGSMSFDDAGKDGLLIQERLTGPEVSVFAVADGHGNYSIIPYIAQDHKRLQNGDKGPNTGGMGAYAPLPNGYLNASQLMALEEMIIRPTFEGMQEEGTPYQGVLYFGLIMAEQYGSDPYVIEFNCRFGDPEAQVILPLLTRSGVDVYQMFHEGARGMLPDLAVRQHLAGSALSVTLAAEGYPGTPRKGDIINGLSKAYPDVQVYHAGTGRGYDGKILTNGGRILNVTGFGSDIDKAAAAAYAAIGEGGIYFDGMQYRPDIGHRIRTN